MTVRDDLGATFLTKGMSDEQLQQLTDAGEEVRFSPGDVPIREGAPADYLWILLEGRVQGLRQSATETTVMNTMTVPGQWAGGLRAWSDDAGDPGYRLTARAATAGRFFRLPSQSLGRLVGEWFPFGKHMIVGIYQTIRALEERARQRESLVALGTLSAGLAHQINNPAAAALRSVDALRDTYDTTLQSLVQLARHTITADQFVALDAARAEAVSTKPEPVGALITAAREEAIAEWLQKRAVEDGWQTAAVLAGAGLDQAWCERIASIVGFEPAGPAVRWVASTITADALLGEMRDSTTRISELVAAVKSYSQMDRAALQKVDIREGIESTLIILSHKLGNIVVERNFEDGLPMIEAYGGELNQVWTNLIYNAIDAMGDSGTLRVSTRCDNDVIQVEVADTGHGMTAEVEARALEPFFTTKDVGGGSGLGLDIARRIVVERHHGSISFSSGPDGTTAAVQIPISSQQLPAD